MSLNPIVDFSIVQIVFNRIRVSLRIFFSFFFQRNGECTYRFNDIHFSSVSDRVKKKKIYFKQKLINFLSNIYIYISENVQCLNIEFFIIQMHS